MDLLVTNVALVDGRGGDPMEDAAVAVEGERIVFAGRAADAPRKATHVIDGRGGFAVPGLINAHTHITLDEQDLATPRVYNRGGEGPGLLAAAARARRALENGITTLRDCNAPGTGTLALRDAFAQKRQVGPRLVCSGCAICAPGGHMHAISYQAANAEAVRAGVRTQVEAGADFIKLVADGTSTAVPGGRALPGLSQDDMAAGVAAARAAGKRVAAHAVSREGARESLAAGADSIEHGYDLPDDLIWAMRERRAWLVPTLSVHGAIVRHGAQAGWSTERLKRSEEVLAMALSSVRRAFRAGVKVACGSDAGSPFNAVWELVPELRLLCEAGLTPHEALQATTRTAAELLGGGAEFGTLEAGKRADLLVVQGDPLRDVAALERPSFVIQDGKLVTGPRIA